MVGLMTEEPSAKRRVRAARAGDREAFDQLVKGFRDRVLAFIRSRIPEGFREKLDPEEILQDALIRAFQAIRNFRGDDPEAFRRWVAGIANKAVLRARDRLKRQPALQIRDDIPAKDVSPTKALRREERFDRLQNAIDSLSRDHRQVIHLTRIQGMSLKEAAGKMGRSPEAVRKLFWRALQQLRKAMTDTGSLELPDRSIEQGYGDEPER